MRCNENDIVSVVFLSKIDNPNLSMKKYRENPIEGHSKQYLSSTAQNHVIKARKV